MQDQYLIKTLTQLELHINLVHVPQDMTMTFRTRRWERTPKCTKQVLLQCRVLLKVSAEVINFLSQHFSWHSL